ncbi:MAG TPA: A24 family peptidase [Candidatus Nanoarchaeia archaeon]|nr:A24 family peptidase [Candidatus Nanoarchaeia archaeon]
MIFWYFLVIVALIVLIICSITDIKKREVPDLVSYSFIAVGFGARLIYSFIEKDFSYLIYGIIGFAIFFVFANLMYYTKQWGGGDCKLLMGLGVVFGNYQVISKFSLNSLPFLGTLLLNILVAGVVYGIVYSIFLGVKNYSKVKKDISKTSFKILIILFIFGLLLILISYSIFDSFIFKMVSLVILICLISSIIIQFTKIIENSLMYKFIKVNKLVEGDWLAKDVFKANKLICKIRNIGLTKEDIEILKKNKIKTVLVKEGIPFVPGFLIGFIVSILFGDFFLFFV